MFGTHIFSTPAEWGRSCRSPPCLPFGLDQASGRGHQQPPYRTLKGLDEKSAPVGRNEASVRNSIPWMGALDGPDFRNIACSTSGTCWIAVAKEKSANHSMAASAVAAEHSRNGLAYGP